MEFDDDTHLCLRCRQTIAGLDNYVLHRQKHCSRLQPKIDAKERPHARAESPVNIISQTPELRLTSTSPSLDVHLTANDFFSCLELQSTVNINKTDVSLPIASNQQLSRFSNNDEVHSTTSNHLYTALAECRNNYDSEALIATDESETEDHPPSSYTGGKWKPGSIPHLKNRQFWDTSIPLSPIADSEKKGDVTLKVGKNSKSDSPVNKISDSFSRRRVFECLTCDKQICGEINFKRHLATNYHRKRAGNQNDLSLGYIKNKRQRSNFGKINQNFNCDRCKEAYSEQHIFAFHLLSVKHRKHFSSDYDWQLDIFNHENNFIHTLKYQCLVCLYYFNDFCSFQRHMKSVKHRQNAAQLKNTLICLPCEFECMASDDLIAHLTRDHASQKVDHPLIIAEKKKNVCCSYCNGKCKGILNNSKETSGHYLSQPTVCSIASSLALELPSLECNRDLQHPNDNNTLQQISNINCHYCSCTCKHTQDWKEHILMVHSDRYRECKLCCRILKSLEKYKEHLDEQSHEHLEETLKTDSEKETSKGPLAKTNSPFSSKIPENPSVQNYFTSEGKLIKNQKKFSCKKRACSFCGKLFSKCHIKTHLLTHTNGEPFKCKFCSRVFTQQGTLNLHLKQHLELKLHKCKKCDFQAVHKYLLIRHELTHESNRPRPFTCDVCDSAHFNKSALAQHKKIHWAGQYSCDKCTHQFHSQSRLVEHMRCHSDKRPYLCDKCGYSGKFSHQLKQHQRSHTGERPFKCKYCSYTASLSSQLMRHTRLHTGSKPYKCPYCAYSCNNQENIRKHILKTKKHKGKKMYPCRYCDFACDAFQEYRGHLLTDHKLYFPNGEKDVDSSATAGIYTKTPT